MICLCTCLSEPHSVSDHSDLLQSVIELLKLLEIVDLKLSVFTTLASDRSNTVQNKNTQTENKVSWIWLKMVKDGWRLLRKCVMLMKMKIHGPKTNTHKYNRWWLMRTKDDWKLQKVAKDKLRWRWTPKIDMCRQKCERNLKETTAVKDD